MYRYYTDAISTGLKKDDRYKARLGNLASGKVEFKFYYVHIFSDFTIRKLREN